MEKQGVLPRLAVMRQPVQSEEERLIAEERPRVPRHMRRKPKSLQMTGGGSERESRPARKGLSWRSRQVTWLDPDSIRDPEIQHVERDCLKRKPVPSGGLTTENRQLGLMLRQQRPQLGR